MKFILQDDTLYWYIDHKYELHNLQKLIHQKNTQDLKRHRIAVESHTNLFPQFDDDILSQNFLYCFLDSYHNMLKLEMGKRKINLYLNHQTVRQIPEVKDWALFSEVELDSLTLHGGDEEGKYKMILKKGNIAQFFAGKKITPELLEQIVLLGDECK